ncbi:cysteine desulfurase family protein [Thermoactinomyces mirandus]|uniref:Cysteine desulfurase n=1 Tax=Thermoactinomyces mirandus TaxID=2756294 RepID=A0A7W1XUJ9_9BACL|nr:cysteine desulfurase family protein [Thermoactinomyces mirandus]MBA4603332.1 cysteine desulfurase [Thermoactinomyces mirandus]
MIYFDNSATTKVASSVLEEMLPYLKEEYGNPSSKFYSLAVNAQNAVKLARKRLATLLGCDDDEIIFTSGATESNNMVIKGVANTYSEQGNHIITSQTEHPSVLETCQYLESKGWKVTYLGVDQFGRINIQDLENAIKKNKPILVSIIWGNNEVGSLNEIEKIASICREHQVFFHTDATQVCGKISINLKELPGIRFLSMSGHKIHGPKGVGVCFIRKQLANVKTKLTPLLHGGSQEDGYRSGTLAVHNIVGLGKAAELANENLDRNIEKLMFLEQKLTKILKDRFGDHIQLNHDNKKKIPGILSVRFVRKNNEVLIKKLAPYIALSTGSACSSGKPSHVLQAMGKSLEEIRQTVRISLSPENTLEELEIFNRL